MNELNVLSITILFLLGLAVGSFINAFEFRLKHGINVVKKRSMCPHCKHELGAWDLVPILSFLWLRGKCRYCHKPISIQYPIVETATGALFAFTAWYYQHLFMFEYEPSFFLLKIVLIFAVSSVLSTFIFFTLYDLKYMIIPNTVVLPLIGIFGIADLTLLIFEQIFPLPYPLHTVDPLSNLAAGVFGFLLFYALIGLTKGKGMGGGDLKLAIFMGLILGIRPFVAALYIAFIVGALYGIVYAIRRGKLRGQKIPFGPFLCLGAVISFFYGERIFFALFPGIEFLFSS